MGENDFLAAIGMFAGNYAPVDWSTCQGSVFAVEQHTALFSLLGTTYGGNGITDFLLPNLSSATTIGAGPTLEGNLVPGEVLPLAEISWPSGLPALPGVGGTTTTPTLEPLNGLVVQYCICTVGLWPTYP